MEEKDVNEIAKYKYMCVASDGNSLKADGPLSSGKPHPRSYGTNTRFIEQFVSNNEIVSFEEAIFRMTSYPAERLSLKKRGKIALNFFADINIFKINEITTFQKHENCMSQRFRKVQKGPQPAPLSFFLHF